MQWILIFYWLQRKRNLKEASKHFNKALSLLLPDSPERKEILELLGKADR